MQHHIYVPTTGPDDWRPLLGNPEKHWRVGYSAHSMAHAWEGVKAWPKAIHDLLKSNSLAIKPLFAFPEFKVDLDTGKAPSQNDLFLMASDGKELWSVAIEGKVQEDFGPLASEWLDVKSNEGRKDRMAFLLKILGIQGIQESQLSGLRYQLFHRTASAVLMAKRLHAKKALMLVQSFEQDDAKDHFEDFEAFVKTVFPGLGSLQRNELSGVVTIDDTIELRLVWVREEMPVVKEPSEVADPVSDTLSIRFEKAVEKLDALLKPDSYTQSYQAFLNFFKGKKMTPDLLIQGIHMVYGWMPTIFEFKGEGDYKAVLDVLTLAKNGKELENADYELLKLRFNNSLVGTSKLLHFINPEVYPIWDSRICKAFFDKPAHQYRVGNVANYLAYKQWIKERTQAPGFADVHSAVETKLGYTVSKVRAAELVLFVSRKG